MYSEDEGWEEGRGRNVRMMEGMRWVYDMG